MRVSGAQQVSRAADPWEIVADLLDRVRRLESQRGSKPAAANIGGGVEFQIIDNGDGTITVYIVSGSSTPVALATLDK